MGQNFSYWEQKSILSDYDVLIIGSGIVGLSSALNLKVRQPSLQIGVLESGFLPSGASTKNAGFACFGSVSEALDEIKSEGEEAFLSLVEMRWGGLSSLRSNLGDEAICFKSYGGYEIFKTTEKVFASECIEHIHYLNHLLKPIFGKHDIYAVDNAKITDFGLAGIGSLIVNKYEGQIDAGKMMTALISKVAGSGVQLLNSCKVLNLEGEEGRFIIQTNQGEFKTKSIIVATNAFAKDLLPELEIVPGRGQVIVTEPINKLRVRGAFHYDRGYTYFRNIDERILLGGFRNLDKDAEQTKDPGITDLIQNALEDLLHHNILPGQKPKIEYRWSGVMGFGPELKPIVREVRPGIYCAVRCSGMGIAMGSLVGEQIAKLVVPD